MAELSSDEKWCIKLRKQYGGDILKASLDYVIPQSLLAAFVLQESYPKLFKDCVRVETVWSNTLNIANYNLIQNEGLGYTSDEMAIACSSLGITQIGGWHCKFYHRLGKTRLGKCGTLNIEVKELMTNPFKCLAEYLVYNCKPYLAKKDYESTARAYNSGSPRKSSTTDEYWKNIKRYMTLYDECLKIPEEELPNV